MALARLLTQYNNYLGFFRHAGKAMRPQAGMMRNHESLLAPQATGSALQHTLIVNVSSGSVRAASTCSVCLKQFSSTDWSRNSIKIQRQGTDNPTYVLEDIITGGLGCRSAESNSDNM